MSKRSDSDWLQLIDLFEVSGLSQTAFCKQRKIDRQRFRINRERLRSQVSSSPFVKALPLRESNPQPSVTIHYRDVTLQFNDCDASTIATMVKQLV